MKKSKFLFFFLVLAFSACGSEIHVTDIRVTARDSLLLSLTLTNIFQKDVRDAIDAGFKVSHTYAISLYEVRNSWWDEKITSVQVRHDIEYDNLRQIYLVTLSEENSKTISLKDFAEARKLMSEIVNLRVAELHELIKGKRYQVRINAQFGRTRPPSLLHDIIIFFPF